MNTSADSSSFCSLIFRGSLGKNVFHFRQLNWVPTMMIACKILITFALLAPVVCNAQSMAYSDADTPSEAVGMMNSTIAIAGALMKGCSSRYPQLSRELNANLDKWKSTNARVIEKTEHYWGEMQKKQPKLAEQTTYAGTVALKSLDVAASAPGSAGVKAAEQYCRQHFADLASGVWRSRTPRAYAFMDNAP
jgi:hypothetical protein